MNTQMFCTIHFAYYIVSQWEMSVTKTEIKKIYI